MTGKLELWDKLLPDQPINNLYYREPDGEYHRRLLETLADAAGTRSPLEEFNLELTEVVALEEMASNPLALSLLGFLVRLSGARTVLEIGAYIGVSTMALAKALPQGGRVITLEKFDHFAQLAQRNCERNGLGDRVEIHHGDAFELLQSLDLPQLDLAFIDGDKERYADYIELVAPRLRPGGLMIVDDVLFQGDVLNDVATTAKGAGVKRSMEAASKMTGWQRCALPFSDGILLMIKPG